MILEGQKNSILYTHWKNNLKYIKLYDFFQYLNLRETNGPIRFVLYVAV